MTIKGMIQWLLLIWFVALSTAVLIPSYQMLFGPPEAASPGDPPPPPVPPLAPVFAPGAQTDPVKLQQQLEAYKQQTAVYAEQVKSYTQEVVTYTQQVSAYRTHQEARSKSGRVSVYELVVKNTLLSLASTFVIALLGYVLASLGAGLLDNYARMRNGAAAQPLSLV